MKGLLKKNQIIIYVIAIMLMTAGYLNYTTKQGGDSVETSIEMDSKDDTKLADIGDATLVSSNDIVGEIQQIQILLILHKMKTLIILILQI